MKISPLADSRWITSSRQIGLLTVGLLLVLWALLAYWATISRELAVENRQAALTQTVAVAEEQAAQMLSLIKVALLTADHWIAGHPDEDPGENQGFIQWVEELRKASGQRVDIRMVTRDARLAYVPKRTDAAATDVSDREYFRVQNDPATRGFHVAASVFSRVTGKWGIPVSVAARNPQGHIAVLFGVIELDSLEKLQAPLLASPGDSIYLIRRDGIVLSRIPVLPDMIGTSLAATPTWTDHLSRGGKGVYIIDREPFAGIERIVAFSHMQDYPLIIVASAPLESVLAPWRKHVAILVLFGVAISVGFSLMAVQLASAVRMNELARMELEKHATLLQQTNQELNVLSVTDKLTQVYNRVRLDDVLEHEISRAKRYQQDLSLVMLDIDHFKQINDTHGHHVGDSVLVKVAEILRKSIRETDTIGRWGGEEFLIILPQTAPDRAFDAAEKIRKSISATEIPVAGRLTASFGVTSVVPGDSERQILERVDNALYEAKAGGRNRVVLKNAGVNDERA